MRILWWVSNLTRKSYEHDNDDDEFSKQFQFSLFSSLLLHLYRHHHHYHRAAVAVIIKNVMNDYQLCNTFYACCILQVVVHLNAYVFLLQFFYNQFDIHSLRPFLFFFVSHHYSIKWLSENDWDYYSQTDY